MASQAPARLVYRKLWEHDLPKFAEHLSRLTAKDRRDRFMGEKGKEAVGRYAAGLNWDRVHLVGCFIDGMLRATAELHLAGQGRLDQGELAFSVEEAHQNRGIATELMRRMLLIARNRGLRKVHLICLAENVRMRRIAQKFRAALALESGEVTAELPLLPPTPGTLLAEAWDDGELFAATAVRITGSLGQRLAEPAQAWLAPGEPERVPTNGLLPSIAPRAGHA